MNMTDIYNNLFGGAVPPAPEPWAEPWVEPALPDYIPKDIQKAIKHTMFTDRKRAMDRARDLAAEQQRSHAVDAARYGASIGGAVGATGIGATGIGATGIGDSAMLQQEQLRAMTASEIAMRQDEQNRRLQGMVVDNAQLAMQPNIWSKKMMDQYAKSIFNQPIVEKDVMGENGSYIEDGVMRIRFPFGEVEMNVSNESELERAYEMAKHMLKVHEENKATSAIKKNLHEDEARQDAVLLTPQPGPGFAIR